MKGLTPEDLPWLDCQSTSSQTPESSLLLRWPLGSPNPSQMAVPSPRPVLSWRPETLTTLSGSSECPGQLGHTSWAVTLVPGARNIILNMQPLYGHTPSFLLKYRSQFQSQFPGRTPLQVQPREAVSQALPQPFSLTVEPEARSPSFSTQSPFCTPSKLRSPHEARAHEGMHAHRQQRAGWETLQ